MSKIILKSALKDKKTFELHERKKTKLGIDLILMNINLCMAIRSYLNKSSRSSSPI